MDEVYWGMIGCGDVTERKSGPALQRVEHSHLVAVASRTPEKARDYARRHGIPRWYRDAQSLIDDPQVNAIYIATPPDSHAEYTLRAAQAGKPVYVEKPMARTYAECQAMVAACRQAGVPLYVAYYRRCLPAFLKVRELVERGAIGEVRFISLRLFHPPHSQDLERDHLPWRVLPEIAGGGYFYDLASHQLDYLDWLFSPITAASGQALNQAGLYPAEDYVSAVWQHASGVPGSGTWCFTVDPAQRKDEAELVGSRGKIRFSFFDSTPILVETGEGTASYSYARQDPIQQPLVQLIVDELRGVGVCPSTGESAGRTNRVMEQIVYGAAGCPPFPAQNPAES